MISISNVLKKIGEYLALLLLASIFVGLGIWQLDRAAELKSLMNAKSVKDTKIFQLSELAQPRTNLNPRVDHKLVITEGFYISNFRAPNQVDGDGGRNDWEVGLLQVDTKSAILVVRGLWAERLIDPQLAMSDRVQVTGTLLMRQIDDHSENAPGIISRLDSSVITSRTDFDLYDGYIMAKSERVTASTIERSRLEPEKIQSRVPGFYWQHLSYVVIWWLMAAIVLYLPVYRRRVKQL